VRASLGSSEASDGRLARDGLIKRRLDWYTVESRVRWDSIAQDTKVRGSSWGEEESVVLRGIVSFELCNSILASHERIWLGALADTLTHQKARVLEMGLPLDEYQPYLFRRGWLHRLAIDGSWFETDDTLARYKSAFDACDRSRPKPPSRALRASLSAAFDACQRARALGLVKFMRTLATCTSARLVEQLFLYSFVTDRADAFSKKYPSMGRVRRLMLGDDGDPRGSGSDHGELAIPLIASMPRLVDLFLWLPELEPARLCMVPTLEKRQSLRVCLGDAPSAIEWPRAIAGSRHHHNLAHLTFSATRVWKAPKRASQCSGRVG
jgi:hypothetical protein